MRIGLAWLAVAGALFTSGRVARACGGGVVTTTQAGTIGADAQRIVLSVHGRMTDVITQIGVPSTTADYGVLIPVPSQPTLDPNPVATADIDALDRNTAPDIRTQQPSDDSDGFSCGCPLKSGSAGAGDVSLPGGAQVSQPVTIGPVTAVTLTADTGDAINAWLADNGFVIPAGSQSIVDSYAGPGRYFIAIRRASTAPTAGATSVGVHFTLAGDERGLPLRFVHLGAAATVGFTVFVAADDIAAPSPPFAALTLLDLNPAVLKSSGYAAALAGAVTGRGGHAFVIEGSWSSPGMSGAIGASLQPFLLTSQRLTRLSAILRAETLDTDVVFDQPFTGTAPNQRTVQQTRPRHGNPRVALGAVALAFAVVLRRRARR